MRAQKRSTVLLSVLFLTITGRHVLAIEWDAHTVLLDHFNGTAAGTVYGSVMYTNSVPGLDESVCISSNAYIQYSFPGWSETSGGTLDMWIRPSQYPAYLMNWNWYDTASSPGSGHVLHLRITAGGMLYYYGWNYSPSAGSLTGETLIPTNAWTHVAVAWGPDGTKLYVNGQEDAYSADNIYPELHPTTYVYLNYWGDNPLGCVDDFRISNVERFPLNTAVNGLGSITPGGGWYAAGTNLDLSAVPESGWLFMGWSGDLSGDYSASNTTLLIDSAKSITAAFSDDADGDGLLNTNEWIIGTDPRDSDTDDDSLPDRYEVDEGLNPLVFDAHQNPDGDALVNIVEYAFGGDPHSYDTGIPPVISEDGGSVYYTHVQRSDDPSLVYRVQTTSNLVMMGWTDTGHTVLSTNVTGGAYNYVTNLITSANHIYIRMVIGNEPTNYLYPGAVGYVRKTVHPGFTLVRYDFKTIDGSTNRTEDVFDGLPIGSTVWRYDPILPGWTVDNKAGVPGVFENWDAGIRANQHIIERGDAYLLQLPGSAAPAEVYILGEVPDDGHYGIEALPGFSGYGYPYPNGLLWHSTAISSNLVIGSTAWRYESGTGWRASNKSGVPGVFESWSDWNLGTGPTLLLRPGDGVLLQNPGGTVQATEIQLYDLQAP